MIADNGSVIYVDTRTAEPCSKGLSGIWQYPGSLLVALRTVISLMKVENGSVAICHRFMGAQHMRPSQDIDTGSIEDRDSRAWSTCNTVIRICDPDLNLGCRAVDPPE